MSQNKEEEVLTKLQEEMARLQRQIAQLDLTTLQSGQRSSGNPNSANSAKSKKTPDWVNAWNRKNASHGEVKTIVATTNVVDAAERVIGRKTELVAAVELPDHLRLGVLHEDRKQVINWDTRPTHDGLAPRGLNDREARAYLEAHPGNLLNLNRLEGPIKPVRKQMLRMNKVWKYRNFKKCENCEAFDTWEARVDPYEVANLGMVHAEIWCHTCSAVDFEVADRMPAHIGSWAPPKETLKQVNDRKERQAYRRSRSTFSLIQAPKTAMQLCLWFRSVEKYEAVDPTMLELMLKKMLLEGLVVFDRKTGLWWDAEDHAFEGNVPMKSE